MIQNLLLRNDYGFLGMYCLIRYSQMRTFSSQFHILCVITNLYIDDCQQIRPVTIFHRHIVLGRGGLFRAQPFSGQDAIIIPLLQFKINYYVFMSFRQRLNPILDSLPQFQVELTSSDLNPKYKKIFSFSKPISRLIENITMLIQC